MLNAMHIKYTRGYVFYFRMNRMNYTNTNQKGTGKYKCSSVQNNRMGFSMTIPECQTSICTGLIICMGM